MAKIKEYSIIGNCRSAALVSKNGSIDWCCFPEFHSPAIFSGLLDQDKAGHFSIAPIERYESVQHYIDDTNVLETIFTCEQGKAKLTDAFVVLSEEDKTQTLFPDHEIIRIVQSISGIVRFRMDYEPKIFYGKQPVHFRDNKKLGIKYSWKENSYVLQNTLAIEQTQITNGTVVSEFVVEGGEIVVFSLSCSSQSSAILPELEKTGLFRLEQTTSYWKQWIKQCNYEGAYKEQVKRSALVLKLLTHAPSGAIIAAPTTSLPEEITGVRNWDYRYCWLRDASFTIRVLLKLGFEQEAHAYMSWILHATQLTQPKLQVVYSVYGHSRIAEQELYWLKGFENSNPVRIGNGAHKQFQLDVYGEVLDAFFSCSRIVEEFDLATRKFLVGLAKVICELWNKPDNGIWEKRSSVQHHTHSKVMAWVGLDRIIRLIKKYNWKSAHINKYESTKSKVEEAIERLGFNKELQSYTSEFGGDSLDASALVFSLVGYRAAYAPQMMSTVKQICNRLSKNKLVYRYRNEVDGLPGSEGCFGICSFWLAENLATSGNLHEAIKVFETVLAHASPTGLLAEEIDPVSHQLLGNYPQGFTHIGLINAAFSISESIEKGGSVHEY
jgi:GH15 family glucan-1,4-alpha-glucosidase